jgi:hypothetical protein
MIHEFICENCGKTTRVCRGKDQKPPRFCSNPCKWEWERNNRNFPVTREWLYQKYIVETLGCPDIAKIVGCDPTTVHYWLETYGIPRRSRGANIPQQFKKGHKPWMEGRHHSDEAKRKVGEASRERGAVPYLRNGVHFNKGKRGAVVANWKGGITPERQAFYRSEEWKEAVKVVWKRDNGICQRCGLDHRTVDRKSPTYRKFQIHHILSFAVVERRCDPSNLVLLCDKCHRFIHSKKNVNKEFIQ